MAAMMAMFALAGGCTHASANVPVDSPKLVPFQAPDIDEITGIDSDDSDAAPAAGDKAAAGDKPAAQQPSSNQAQKPHH